MTDGDVETIDTFTDLFEGRIDFYGSWTGGCVANPDPQYAPYLPMVDHLYNGPFIGVYPLTDGDTVGWGCIDIDGKDFPTEEGHPDFTIMWAIAAELQDVLAYKEVTSWLERTAHGIHVWVFAEERVQATVMRQALLVACEVAQYKPREVNPKQTTVSAERPLGNYVRCPYPGALKNGTPADRFIVDEDGRPMTLEDFSRTAMGSRTSVRLLEAMSKLYVAPARLAQEGVELDAASAEAFEMLRPIFPPVVKMILEDGPLNGDRSSALVKAAVILRDDGWTLQGIFTVLRGLDRNVLRKFADRPDPDQPLLDIINKVCG